MCGILCERHTADAKKESTLTPQALMRSTRSSAMAKIIPVAAGQHKKSAPGIGIDDQLACFTPKQSETYAWWIPCRRLLRASARSLRARRGTISELRLRFCHTTGRLAGVLIRIGQEAISDAWLSDQVSRPAGMRLQLAAQISDMHSKVVGLCAVPRAPHLL